MAQRSSSTPAVTSAAGGAVGGPKPLARERWESIQEGEFHYHAAKDESRVLQANLPYWRSLLGALPATVRFDEGTRALDLGCGGCGILLALDRGVRTGVDPLMGRYLQKFPFLVEQNDIRWVESTAEEYRPDEPQDVIFSINAFDHVFDPARAAARMREMLRPGGHLVLTMNSHNTRFFRRYYSWFYRVIDHHHPFQFTPEDLQRLFRPLESVLVRSIDDLWFPHAESYYRQVLRRPYRDRRKVLKAALNPFKWPMGVCKVLLDMPPHKKRPGQRSIYDNYLYVFRRAD